MEVLDKQMLWAGLTYNATSGLRRRHCDAEGYEEDKCLPTRRPWGRGPEGTEAMKSRHKASATRAASAFLGAGVGEEQKDREPW